MTQEVRDRIVSERWTREQVVATLGNPDAINDESRALGYWRCDPYRVFPFPYPVVEEWETCFLYGFWFDPDGHAIKAGVSGGVSIPIPTYGEPRRALACPEVVWLSRPGGGCPKH